MAKGKLRVPENQPELYDFTSPSGYGLEDLEKILEIEISDRKRRYVATRLVQRINQLRGEKLYTDTMREISK